MNVLETEWWTLALPPEWWAETEDDAILVGDRAGVGCIEITTLQKEQGEFDQATVKEIARSEAPGGQDWNPAELGDFRGVLRDYLDEDAAIREWYVAQGPLLLFITYSCEEENRGMDAAAVDQLLDTLMLVS
jgi:hypothetical protein